MASLRVLAFDHEGRPVQFDTWLDDLQLYLLSDSKDSVSLFDLASGAAIAPPATADSSTRSRWLTRDAAARLAIRNHLPLDECAHFVQHRTAQALYDAIDAHYSSPATAALGRLLLPYLFPELSAFTTVEDLVSHLCASDARYRTAVHAEFLDRNPPLMYITLYFIVTRLPDSLRSVKDHFLSLDPTSLTVDLLEQHLLAVETSAVVVGAARGTLRPPFFEGCSPSPLAPSYASAAAADVSVPVDVGAASASAKRRSSKGKGDRGGGGGSGGGGGGSGSGGGGSSGGGGGGGIGGRSGGSGGGGGGSGGCGGSGGSGTSGGGIGARRVSSGGGQRQQQQRRSETLSPQQLHEIAIFDLIFDAILSAMYASAEGDCYRCVPPDPGIATAALGASESGTLPGTALAEALHTFTLDFGASRCFFRDSTTLTPLPAPVPVRLAGPSRGPAVARSSTVIPCPAVLSGSQSVLHLPSFSTNLVSTAALQDAMVTTTTPEGQRVSICTCTRTGHHLATFTHRPGPILYTLATEPSQVAASAQVSALDLHVMCLHSDRGGEFSSNLLRDFCRGEGILQSFMLPDSPQQNGIAERRIGLVMELNLWPRISLPETSPTLRWTGEVGNASVFRVWGSRAFVRDTSADKLSPRAIPCVFLGFVPDASGWQFYHPTSRRVFPSLDVTFDESVPFYCLFPYRSAPPPPPPLFLAPGPPLVDSLPPQGPAPSGVSQVDPLPSPVPVQVAVDSGAARGTASGGAEPGGAESEGAETGGAEPVGVATGGAEPGGVATGGGEPKGAEPEGVEPGGAASEGAKSGGAEPQGATPSGASGAGGTGVSAGAGVTGGTATTGPGGGRTRGSGAAGSGGVEGTGVGDLTESGTTGAGGAGAGGAGVGGPGVGGAGAVDPGGTVRPRPYFSQPPLQPASPLPAPSPYTEQFGGLTERRGPPSRPVSPVRTAHRVPHSCPPPVPSMHAMTLRPSSVPLCVPLPAPPESSLPEVLDPESDSARGASPTVSLASPAPPPPPSPTAADAAAWGGLFCFACCADYTPLWLWGHLATAVTDPSFESATTSALVAELLDFAAAFRLDDAIALVAESASASPLFLAGECALGTDVLEDRQEDFESLAAAVPRFASMLLAPEGDPDAPDIPTLRSYAEAITGPYSYQWQAAMDAEMASWKSTGTYIDKVSPPRANIVDGMWIFRVKRPPGSPPVFKACYVARGFSQRQGVDYF
ncbi:unnamed protein product [Closterium sp. NIES-53]